MQKHTSLSTIFTLLLFFSGTALNAQNTTGQLTDERDQETYKTVKIGGQWWMAENLNFKKDTSWVYKNSDENGTKFGRLYTWQSAMTGCPADWHLPTDEEWMELESTLGMSDDDLEGLYWRGNDQGLGNLLKSDSEDWPSLAGDQNEFNATPGGFFKQMVILFAFKKSKFRDMGTSGVYWTATAKDKRAKGNAYYRFFDDENAGIFRSSIYKAHAYSVRCVKD